MQKNLSQFERYTKGINRNVKGNLVAGVIIIFVMIIVHLLNGCEPILPDESVKEKTDINEWDIDTVVYHSDAKPAPHK